LYGSIWRNSPFTEDIIDIYMNILKKYKNAGIAIQSNLKRSESDIRENYFIGGE